MHTISNNTRSDAIDLLNRLASYDITAKDLMLLLRVKKKLIKSKHIVITK